MLQVLSPNNFTVNKLRELYQKMVLPFTDLHSIHRHTKETSMFFENKIKPMFQCMFNQYPGDNVVVKFINLIQEIRINILNSILETIEEYRYSSQIILEPYQVELIKFLIIQHKHQLAKASSSCHDCIMFRSLIDGILHANPILYNHHVFGSWRFFDPCNNKRNGLFSSGLFTYQLNKLQQTTLHVFGIDIDDEMLSQPNHFVVHVIEVIAFYYLITKETSISIFNQKQRFNTYMKIIVQVLRGHNNKDEKLFVDLPLCPGAIKEHLIKCGEQYGDSKFKFISFKDIVENAISREVYSRLNSKTESLTESMSLQEIYKLCQALSITGQNLFTCTTIMQKPQQNLQFINRTGL